MTPPNELQTAESALKQEEAKLFADINKDAANLRGNLARLSGKHPFLKAAEHTLDWLITHLESALGYTPPAPTPAPAPAPTPAPAPAETQAPDQTPTAAPAAETSAS